MSLKTTQYNDEQQLVTQSLAGDQQAYAVLVDRYKAALYHHCFAILRSEAVAEDIAQDTFITAYFKLATYNSEYRLSTWLFKIATNKSLNWLRKTAREIAADDELVARIASSQPEPPLVAQHTELRDAVHRLQPSYRAVISLYYWHGLSYEEIATILSAPVGSIKGWMNRAKSQLRQELS